MAQRNAISGSEGRGKGRLDRPEVNARCKDGMTRARLEFSLEVERPADFRRVSVGQQRARCGLFVKTTVAVLSNRTLNLNHH